MSVGAVPVVAPVVRRGRVVNVRKVYEDAALPPPLPAYDWATAEVRQAVEAYNEQREVVAKEKQNCVNQFQLFCEADPLDLDPDTLAQQRQIIPRDQLLWLQSECALCTMLVSVLDLLIPIVKTVRPLAIEGVANAEEKVLADLARMGTTPATKAASVPGLKEEKARRQLLSQARNDRNVLLIQADERVAQLDVDMKQLQRWKNQAQQEQDVIRGQARELVDLYMQPWVVRDEPFGS